ncbi:substrate-binding domain-containing protein [Cellulomonas marina]|nr:substrate-binding domain-containing protein [Cellulomonas marina]
MAADDEIAVGGLAAARTFGVPVSERLRVVRFDDTPQAPWITPLHTTVHQHLDGTGRMAAQTVVAMSSDTAPPPATST